jgi:hypothetical protein
MTRDEAIAIRSRQLSGGAVSINEAREAEEVLKQGPQEKPRIYGTSGEVLTRLARGPMEWDDLLATAKERYGDRNAWATIKRLEERGLIACEVRLTEKGARALGGKSGSQS